MRTYHVTVVDESDIIMAVEKEVLFHLIFIKEKSKYFFIMRYPIFDSECTFSEIR